MKVCVREFKDPPGNSQPKLGDKNRKPTKGFLNQLRDWVTPSSNRK